MNYRVIVIVELVSNILHWFWMLIMMMWLVMSANELANKWINEMKVSGLSYDDMLRVFAMARKKLELIHSKNESLS